MIKTLAGPDNLFLVLDSSQIFPDDPGEGTPALVIRGKYSATYWCAVGEEELEDYKLSPAQVDWLVRQEAAVDTFISKELNGKSNS